MRMISLLSLFTMVLVFLSHSTGTVKRPEYCGSAMKYRSCKCFTSGWNGSGVTFSPGKFSSAVGKRQPVRQIVCVSWVGQDDEGWSWSPSLLLERRLPTCGHGHEIM